MISVEGLKYVCMILVLVAPPGNSYAINVDDDMGEDEALEFIDLSSFGENAFVEPDNETTGQLVAEYNEESDHNPEELGAYFEGDILIPVRSDIRNGLVSRSSRWPGGVVPYEIAGTFNSNELAVITWALGEYHQKTCIRFKPRTREKDYISIVNGKSGCWSAVGRMGGKQEVNFQTPSCLLRRGTSLHELMHALGFIHEQNRHERDSYVTVRAENIKDNMMINFAKSSEKTAHGMGIGYDYASVMHYSPKSFSKNGKPTIEAKIKSKEAGLMGQRSGFSTADLAKINLMYSCKRHNAVEEDDEYYLDMDYLEA